MKGLGHVLGVIAVAGAASLLAAGISNDFYLRIGFMMCGSSRRRMY